jgi:hypothetical protein
VISKDETVSVSVLPPHAKPVLQPKHKELRSTGNNVGANTSIALDSASSIHLFKDRSLLSNIKVDNKKNLKVRSTDSTFHVNGIGEICNTLKPLPLPSEGYYYYPKGVANILSLALLAKTKRVVMDTAIKTLSMTLTKMDPISSNEPRVMAIQTVKDEQSKFSNIDCTWAEAIRKLQEVLACPTKTKLTHLVMIYSNWFKTQLIDLH